MLTVEKQTATARNSIERVEAHGSGERVKGLHGTKHYPG